MISWDFTTGVLLHSITLQKVTNDPKLVCDNDLTNKKLFDALKGIPNNKYPGNGWLTKEFYELFLDELKGFFIKAIKLAYQKRS